MMTAAAASAAFAAVANDGNQKKRKSFLNVLLDPPTKILATLWSRLAKPLQDFGFGRTRIIEGSVGLFIVGGVTNNIGSRIVIIIINSSSSSSSSRNERAFIFIFVVIVIINHHRIRFRSTLIFLRLPSISFFAVFFFFAVPLREGSSYF